MCYERDINLIRCLSSEYLRAVRHLISRALAKGDIADLITTLREIEREAWEAEGGPWTQ